MGHCELSMISQYSWFEPGYNSAEGQQELERAAPGNLAVHNRCGRMELPKEHRQHNDEEAPQKNAERHRLKHPACKNRISGELPALDFLE